MNKRFIFISFFSCFLLLSVSFSGNTFAKETEKKPSATAKSGNDDYEVLTVAIDPQAFDKGYRLFEKEKYLKACPFFYNYLSNHTPDDPDYEWAKFFFGICLNKSGFTHASVDILSHLVIRKPNPKIVAFSLELFEEITRTIPFDRELIIHNVICDNEYGFVDKSINDYINYYQGVFDWEHGFMDWGNEHFEHITPGTYYHYKYLYQKALYNVYQDKVDEAIDILQSILSEFLLNEEKSTKNKKDFPKDIGDDARITLARLMYEKQQYKEAHLLYNEIEKPILDQAQSLLEMAWIQYRMGNAEKAMGLLFAFEAPSFQRYFSPEHYLLKSFIYRDVCHYQSALSVVHEFYRHYGNSLTSIYNRGKIADNRDLLLVLLSKKKIKQEYDFIGLLEEEVIKARVFEKKEIALYKYLYNIYELQYKESSDNFKKQIEEEYEKIANELLKYEEEAYLMEYEIGLDMSKRAFQSQYSEKKQDVKKASHKQVFYSFQGEFWNDELADYKVALPNKCKCMDEWDIFFK